MKELDDLRGDVIDSRDIIEAIEELETFIEDKENEKEEIEEAEENLKEIKEFVEPFEGDSEWKHGTTLICEDYWEYYVEELVKDCGDLPSEIPHYIYIDWEQTAECISQDYMLENGYYMRSC